MPQRQNVVTIPATEVQGADSWITIKRLTVAQGDEVRAITRGMNTAAEDEDETLVKSLGDSLTQLFASCVVGWNWVNDDGEPLLQPRDEWRVLNELTTEEITFVGKALRGEDEQSLKKKKR